jgi:hypothetical protein
MKESLTLQIFEGLYVDVVTEAPPAKRVTQTVVCGRLDNTKHRL